MENQEILKKIEELFIDQKSSKFLTHLLHSYLPLTKSKTVENKPAGKYGMKCAITGTKLVSADEVLTLFQSQDVSAFVKSLVINTDDKGNVIPSENTFKEKLNGRVLGYTGEETNTFLCSEALTALNSWTLDKLLRGDKKINYIVKKLNLNKQNNNSNNSSDKSFTKKPYKKTPKQVIKTSSISLGDFQALKDLKVELLECEKTNK